MTNPARGRLSLLIGALASLLIAPPGGAAPPPANPKLILQITVDALRGDLPARYLPAMGEGGFRYLMEQGIHYSNAHYRHANTETIVGHTSLATGTVPAIHGMVGNVWYDRALGRGIYNIEDPRYHMLSAGAGVDASTEIDPTQRVAKSDGRSPRALLTSTFSDELAIRFNGQSKIFAVSVKDRGAVPLAGSSGKAFWFSKASGEFVSSNYYYDVYPEWVNRFNAAKPTAAYADKRWELMHAPSAYRFGDADDSPWETNFPGYGRVFPHAFGPADSKYFTTFLTLSPAGDEMTLAFAKKLLEEEQLGVDEIPDYLSISFSSNDYVHHLFGASSLEAEDNLLHLDRRLAELFALVDKQVGLQNTLIVFSADHGTPEVPDYLATLGDADAHLFDSDSVLSDALMERLTQRFGAGKALIVDFAFPYVYLNHVEIAKRELSSAEVARVVADHLATLDGVTAALTAQDIVDRGPGGTLIDEHVYNNFLLQRSGDIHVVLDPNSFINDFDGLTVASTHGSPWRYDTHVPVIFAGFGLTGTQVHRRVAPYDIAVTLSAVVDASPPTGTIGEVLPEVVD